MVFLFVHFLLHVKQNIMDLPQMDCFGWICKVFLISLIDLKGGSP